MRDEADTSKRLVCSSRRFVKYDSFLAGTSSSSYDRNLSGGNKSQVRRREMTILQNSTTSGNNELFRNDYISTSEMESADSLDRASLNDEKFMIYNENSDDEFGLRYRPRRLILVGGILFFGILGILIFNSFVERSTIWPLPNSSPLRNHHRINDDEYLVPADPDFSQPASWSKLRTFKSAAVCADGAPCAEIGKSMLDRNGSAIDAALAAMICNGLINMQSMGIGGGFLMSFYERTSGQAYFLNAREIAPLDSRWDMYVNKSKLASRIGGLAIGVPGEIAGYWEAHRKFGKLPWAELFEPSIRLCKEGYNLTRAQYDALFVHPPNIYDDPTLRWSRTKVAPLTENPSYIDGTRCVRIRREMFVINPDSGQFARPGTLIKPKKLCETMQMIADNGASILYNGKLGESLVNDLKKRGGILTMKDLNYYRPLWSKPIRTSLYGGLELITSGLPSSGPLLAFILNILEKYRFSAKSLSTVNETILTYHRIIEAWKYAYAMRTQLGDENFVDLSEIIEKLTSKDYAISIKENIRDDETSNDPKYYGAETADSDDHGTAHISVLAANGDAVSVTSSVNFYFGSGIVSETTGILMNNAMDDFGTTSGSNYFGIPAGKNNFIVPGKRSYSSMVPSIIIEDNGDVRMIIGGAGGTKITTSVSYVIARHLWMNNTIKEAIDAARIHHQLFPMELSYEYGVTRPILQGLTKLGHRKSRYRDRGSIICALVRLNGTIYANADYRKNGDVYGID